MSFNRKPGHRKRGRPRLSWDRDPGRYLIAMADAFRMMGASENEALTRAVAVFEGKELEGRFIMVTFTFDEMVKVDALEEISYDVRIPGAATTMNGRVSTLRKKASNWPPDTMPWGRCLTRQKIGQIWIHHANDDGSPYGTKTRLWLLDTVIAMTPLKCPDTSVSFRSASTRRACGSRTTDPTTPASRSRWSTMFGSTASRMPTMTMPPFPAP